jgi:hypothetical protein
VYLLSLLGNGLVKRYRGNDCTRNNRRIVGRVVCYAARVVSNEVGDLFFPELISSIITNIIIIVFIIIIIIITDTSRVPCKNYIKFTVSRMATAFSFLEKQDFTAWA